MHATNTSSPEVLCFLVSQVLMALLISVILLSLLLVVIIKYYHCYSYCCCCSLSPIIAAVVIIFFMFISVLMQLLSLSLSLSLLSSPQLVKADDHPPRAEGSVRGFCLLTGSFSLPPSPSACSWWYCWVSVNVIRSSV